MNIARIIKIVLALFTTCIMVTSLIDVFEKRKDESREERAVMDAADWITKYETPDHPKSLELIRRYFLHPPSDKPYNVLINPLKTHREKLYSIYKRTNPSWNFIKSILTDLYKEKLPGFFVEVGAFDGEFQSNTLFLEMEYNWTGLLIEANPIVYQMLLKKNRKVWSSPLGLSDRRTAYKSLLERACNNNFINYPDLTQSKLIKDYNTKNLNTRNCFDEITCVPLHSLLLSLNRTKVDFISLDVEGVEVGILQNFAFNKVQVDVWAIEHLVKKPLLNSSEDREQYTDNQFIEFMENKGYYLFDMVCWVFPDYIFIRKESEIFRSLRVPLSNYRRRNICGNQIIINEYLENKLEVDVYRDRTHFPNIIYNTPRPLESFELQPTDNILF